MDSQGLNPGLLGSPSLPHLRLRLLQPKPDVYLAEHCRGSSVPGEPTLLLKWQRNGSGLSDPEMTRTALYVRVGWNVPVESATPFPTLEPRLGNRAGQPADIGAFLGCRHLQPVQQVGRDQQACSYTLTPGALAPSDDVRALERLVSFHRQPAMTGDTSSPRA